MEKAKIDRVCSAIEIYFPCLNLEGRYRQISCNDSITSNKSPMNKFTLLSGRAYNFILKPDWLLSNMINVDSDYIQM